MSTILHLDGDMPGEHYVLRGDAVIGASRRQ